MRVGEGNYGPIQIPRMYGVSTSRYIQRELWKLVPEIIGFGSYNSLYPMVQEKKRGMAVEQPLLNLLNGELGFLPVPGSVTFIRDKRRARK